MRAFLESRINLGCLWLGVSWSGLESIHPLSQTLNKTVHVIRMRLWGEREIISPGSLSDDPQTSSAEHASVSDFTTVLMPKSIGGRWSIQSALLFYAMRDVFSCRWNRPTRPFEAGWYTVVRLSHVYIGHISSILQPCVSDLVRVLAEDCQWLLERERESISNHILASTYVTEL